MKVLHHILLFVWFIHQEALQRRRGSRIEEDEEESLYFSSKPQNSVIFEGQLLYQNVSMGCAQYSHRPIFR